MNTPYTSKLVVINVTSLYYNKNIILEWKQKMHSIQAHYRGDGIAFYDPKRRHSEQYNQLNRLI